MSSITSEIKLRIKAEGEAVFQGLSAKLNNLASQTTISSAKFKVLSNELRDVQEKYPDSHVGQRWAPVRLGGTAPAPLN